MDINEEFKDKRELKRMAEKHALIKARHKKTQKPSTDDFDVDLKKAGLSKEMRDFLNHIFLSVHRPITIDELAELAKEFTVDKQRQKLTSMEQSNYKIKDITPL